MSTLDRSTSASRSDGELIDAIQAGDESAFVELVNAHHRVLIHAAMTYVHSRAVAEEVVQETWLGVLKGLGGFERRSSLRTWIFHIMKNIANTRAVRERRSTPFSALAATAAGPREPCVDPDRFFPADAGARAGRWARQPDIWETPEDLLLSRETQDVVLATIEQLPPAQKLVVALRDLGGWSAEETCRALELTDANQRVLLHRGRCRLRAALEGYLTPSQSAA